MVRFVFLLVILVFAPRVYSKPIDPVFSGDRLWSQKSEEFYSHASKLGYEWTSSANDSARAASKGLTAFGLPVVESIARFKDDKLSEVIVLFYARGDVGEMSKDNFDDLVRKSAEILKKFTGTPFSQRGKDPTNAVKADGLIWQTEKARFLLEFSFTKEVKSRDIPFRAEFVRLEITPPDKNGGSVVAVKNTASGKFSGAEHVKRDAGSGDVWLSDVPMVDQGRKGYCVVAATERVLRYYGVSVDQQELAQAANSSSEGGTSGEAMLDALKKLSARFKVRVRELETFSVDQILELITDYNRAAKRADLPPIPEQGQLLDVAMIYRAMNVDALRQIRTKNKTNLDRFQRTIQAHIDRGTPLLWTVMLGKVPEPNIPQNAGGHMRLIIGYNSKNQEVIFSDSWGAGHELKRMSAADAWTITTGVMSVEPF